MDRNNVGNYAYMFCLFIPFSKFHFMIVESSDASNIIIQQCQDLIKLCLALGHPHLKKKIFGIWELNFFEAYDEYKNKAVFPYVTQKLRLHV